MIEVAIAILLHEQRILVARRRPHQSFAGLWEFPGGKLEPGESPADALHRELREELAIEVDIIHTLPPIDHVYPAGPIRLHPFLCRPRVGSPSPTTDADIRWLLPCDLSADSFPPANAVLLPQILQVVAHLTR
jgi:mutator protein MutT